ncbi:MAG: DUF2183 domain-containing protein [Actinomycetaceae bacterium]|nr:DUF2183 domain-containing protein [Actinomycetaceae bacterium]
MLLRAVTKAGDAFNTAVVQVLSDLGWRTEMIAYGGLGNERRARVIGRALMAPTFFEHKYEVWANRHGLPGWYELHSRTANMLPNAVGEVVRDAIGADQGDDTPTTAHMRGERGWRQFVDAQVPFAPVLVTLGRRREVLYTDRGGYVDVTLDGHGLEPGWHSATLQALKPDEVARGLRRVRASRPIRVPVRIVSESETVGLVSDVDDTVMVSWLPRPMVAAKNAFFTYVSSRQAVPGMAFLLNTLSRRSRSEGPAPLVYLSTGAWNVAPSLRRFLARSGFPTGTPLMTDWGPSQTGWFRSGQEHKRSQLRLLAEMFPWVKWVLVGDDGQHDPSIYTDFAREYPQNVAGIFIRTLTTREQMLNHGAADPLEELGPLIARVDPKIPVFVGEDGFALTREAEAAGWMGL